MLAIVELKLLCGGRDELSGRAVLLAHELVGRTLNDTARDRKRAAHAGEVRVDVTSRHAALVNAPVSYTHLTLPTKRIV